MEDDPWNDSVVVVVDLLFVVVVVVVVGDNHAAHCKACDICSTTIRYQLEG